MKDRLHAHFAPIDPVMASIVSSHGPYELGMSNEGSVFEALARSIASQQLSTAVARTINGRLVALHAGSFPTPAQMVAATPESLRTVGFSFAKIAALKDLAAHVLDGRIPADAELAAMDDEAIIERCVAVRGIGRWTVQMLLMFHFGRQDVMPVDDFGVRNGFRLAYGLKGMPKPKALLAYAERWKPWRSAGAWYMWRALEMHVAGNLPKRSGRAPRIELEKPKAVAAVVVKKKKKVVAKKAVVATRTVAGRKKAASARKVGPRRINKGRSAPRR
jgi:DNA-3-methyladenine glycosylase II